MTGFRTTKCGTDGERVANELALADHSRTTKFSAVEMSLARRLHAAAIAKGKAEAALERVSADSPACFKVKARLNVAQAVIDWLRVYFEAVQHVKNETMLRRKIPDRPPDCPDCGKPGREGKGYYGPSCMCGVSKRDPVQGPSVGTMTRRD